MTEEEKPNASAEVTEAEEATTLHERAIAALAYAGPMAIVPFYLKKESKFCRFHGKQGMLLFILFFLGKLFTVVDILNDLMILVQVFFFFSMGMAAISGRWKKMPLFYNWACEFEETLSLKTKEEEAEDEPMKAGQTGPVTDEPTKNS